MKWGARTEADYEIRLTDRVRQWESKHAAESAMLRLAAQRNIGMSKPPDPGSIREMILERAYREEVRKLHPKWPTLKAWMRGEE